ncbi:MAG: protein kinase domain-containing protein, partial [bacterium]
MIPGRSFPHFRSPLLSDAILARLNAALRDSYLIERELGEGGAATVYLARDLRHRRPVAIKVLKPELAETLGAERFTREIHTAANLQHPHILTVHDSGSADGLLFYVMPYVEGESLRARIEREGSFPLSDAARILSEVADALSAAHAQGVVHRDIKPDNVLLSGRHALVADFGVAKAISEASSQHRLTTVGVTLGTPAYMAPEQAAADPYIDHRVDIYALGLLGYEMLTGDPPFVRRTPQAVIAAHATEPAPAVSARRPSVPPALDALIARCLAKQPADRWQSADEIVAELERLSTPSQAVVQTTDTVLVATSSPVTPRNRVAIAGLAAVVLAALAWAAVARLGSAKPTDENVVAVLPFELNASPDLAYLREGIVNVLETNLTGAGGPRAVASQTVIARWKRQGGDTRGLTEDESRTLARELGAGHLLRGSIVGTAGNLILSGTLVSSAPGGQAIQSKVSGPADSIAVLSARLAAQLLSLRVGEGAERAASLQSVPPSALFAYLEGQGHLRAGRYADATKAFDRALAIDSTFALAGMAQVITGGWSPTTVGDTRGGEIAFRHRDKLGPRDLALLQMFFPSRFEGRTLTGREVLAYRERIVQQILDRSEAWYLIGDQYFHGGLLSGFSYGESNARAENAFRKALALEPGITYLRAHLVDLAWDPLEPARLKHVADSVGPTTQYEALKVALVMADSATVRRLRGGFDTLSTDELGLSAFFSTMVGAPTVGRELIGKALGRTGDEFVRRNVLREARQIYWQQGRPGDASKAHGRLRELSPRFELANPQDVVLAAIFADGDTLDAAFAAKEYRRVLETPVTPGAPPPFAHRGSAFLVGLWAAYHTDSATVAASI